MCAHGFPYLKYDAIRKLFWTEVDGFLNEGENLWLTKNQLLYLIDEFYKCDHHVKLSLWGKDCPRGFCGGGNASVLNHIIQCEPVCQRLKAQNQNKNEDRCRTCELVILVQPPSTSELYARAYSHTHKIGLYCKTDSVCGGCVRRLYQDYCEFENQEQIMDDLKLWYGELQTLKLGNIRMLPSDPCKLFIYDFGTGFEEKHLVFENLPTLEEFLSVCDRFVLSFGKKCVSESESPNKRPKSQDESANQSLDSGLGIEDEPASKRLCESRTAKPSTMLDWCWKRL